MKSLCKLLLSTFLLLQSGKTVWAYDPVIEKVLSKEIIGTLTPQQKAVVYPNRPQSVAFQLPGYPVERARSATKATPKTGVPSTKQYRIINDPYRFHSLIGVQDPRTGTELKRLSVGRRAIKLLPSPATQRLYVLCGGYFSSIWEINTTTDMVIRKLPAFSPQKGHEKPLSLWNPGDIALLPAHQILAVGGTKLQLIDLRSGQVRQEASLPPGQLKITHMAPASRHLLKVSMQTTKGQQRSYLFNPNTNKFMGSGGGVASASPYSTAITTATNRSYLPHHHIAFIGSKNNDYVYILDLIGKSIAGLIPLDFPADDILVSHDRQRLFVYHRSFGQISIVDLALNSPTRFSVVARHADERFKSLPEAPFHLAQDAMDIYLCDQQKKIAAIHAHTHYLRMGVQFQARPTRQSDKVLVSTPGRQRLYLRNQKLYSEKIQPTDRLSSNPQEIPLSQHLQSIALSQDQRLLYALDNKTQQIIAYDVVGNQERYRLPTGKNPTGLLIAGNTLFTLSADEGTLLMADVQMQQVVQVLPLDVGLFQPYIITLYDEKMAQFIHLELPRFLKQAALMVG